MATGSTTNYSLPYPVPTDPVDVAGDIQDLASSIDALLPELTTPNTKITAYNGSASTIAVGSPVFISGIHTSGDPRVTKSNASSASTMPAIGIAASNMGPGNSGEIVILGVVDADINTSAYTVGQYLYVAASGGGLTGTQPIYPNYSQQIGIVLKSSPSTGRIMMIPGNNPGSLTWGQMTFS
jgi:hypothetical protein